jgi:serine/threonine protein kinase
LDVLLGNEYVTMAADVWACGAIYLHMLAGVSPWIHGWKLEETGNT